MTKLKRRKNNSVIKAFFFAGAVVMFWRGSWGLMDLYLFPGNPALSYMVCLIFSILLYAFIARNHIKDLV